MSLDLPPLPITPKDSEFLQRRPDLFYPYLPTPFLNGVQQKVNIALSSFFFPKFNFKNSLRASFTFRNESSRFHCNFKEMSRATITVRAPKRSIARRSVLRD